MIKIPKSKVILGEKWKVSWKWRLVDEDGNECYGLCDFKNRVIFLDRSIPKDMRLQVFFHEELHALFHELCIGLHRDIEESIVEGVERYVFKNYKVRFVKD